MEDKLNKKFESIVNKVEGYASTNKGISDVEQGILSELMSLGKDMLGHYIKEKETTVSKTGVSNDDEKKR
jgi:hypothetical protein